VVYTAARRPAVSKKPHQALWDRREAGGGRIACPAGPTGRRITILTGWDAGSRCWGERSCRRATTRLRPLAAGSVASLAGGLAVLAGVIRLLPPPAETSPRVGAPRACFGGSPGSRSWQAFRPCPWPSWPRRGPGPPADVRLRPVQPVRPTASPSCSPSSWAGSSLRPEAPWTIPAGSVLTSALVLRGPPTSGSADRQPSNPPDPRPGLLECYVAAIPFFGNTLLSDLAYLGPVSFGLDALVLLLARRQKASPGHMKYARPSSSTLRDKDKIPRSRPPGAPAVPWPPCASARPSLGPRPAPSTDDSGALIVLRGELPPRRPRGYSRADPFHPQRHLSVSLLSLRPVETP